VLNVRAVASAILIVAVVISCKEPTAPQVATIVELSMPAQDLIYGSTGTATATVKDQRGNTMTGATVTWSSSNSAIVDVSPAGVLSPTGVGTATITATSAGASSSKDVNVLAKTIAVTATDSSLVPFAVLTVDVGEAIPNFSTLTLLGIRGTDTLQFSATGAQRMETLVVGLDEGAASMKLMLGSNHLGNLPLTIAAAPTVANPQAVVDDVRKIVDSTVASLTAAVAANAGTPENANFAGALGAWFKQTMDTASTSTKMALAQFLATYPELLPSATAPAIGRVAFVDKGFCAGNAPTLEEGIATCGSRLNIGIAAIAGGAIATRTICKAPNWFCLVAVTTTFGAVAVTYDLAKDFQQLPGVVTDGFDGVLDEASPMVIGKAASSASLLANLNLISGKRYTFSATASYRSIVAADAARSNFLSKAVTNLTAFDETWQSLVSIVNAVPAAVRSTLPALPSAVGKAPTLPKTTKNSPIPLGSLKVSNPSSNITLFTDSDWATNTTTVTLKNGLEGDYSFDLTYLSDVGAALSTASGKIRVQAELSRVSGNDQTSYGSAELLEPLKVLVKNKVTNQPVPGVAIQWVAGEGSGSVSASSSTSNSAGIAEVKWTLGPQVVLQSVQATAAYGDASPVPGSPLDFSAKIGVEGYYKLTLVDGRTLPTQTWSDAGGSATLMHGYLELRADSTWTWSYEESITNNGFTFANVDVFEGTYSVRGEKLYLKFMTEDGEPECECEVPIAIPSDTAVIDYRLWDTEYDESDILIWTFKRAVKPATP
jgi:hypothetical protein